MPTASPADSQARASALVVFPWCLDQLGHGNIQRVLAFARYLARKGVTVDLVYQGHSDVPSREAELTGFGRVIRVVRGPGSDDRRLAQDWKTFYSGLPEPPANLTAGGALTMAVRGLLEASDYNAVISTYAWTAPIFEPLERRALRICDAQDVLHLHGERSVQATGKSTVFAMAEETERFLWRKWDVLLAISPEEAQIMAPTLRPTQRLLTMGHAVRTQEPSESAQPARECDHVVYTASDNPSNRQAVTWLLEDVWPKVLTARPHSRLRIVGLICDALRDTPLGKKKHVTLAGFVDRPADELRAAAVVVAPYLYGSGLKIKVLEAAAAGRAIVTTSGGLDGTGMTPGTHLLVEDKADAFADALARVLDDRDLRGRLGTAARTYVDRTFSEDACYGPLFELVTSRAEQPFTPGVIPPSVGERLRNVLAILQSPPVVVWGNGSHTRALMSVLESMSVHVRCIADKAAATDSTSPEGIPVVPGCTFESKANDLIVLSSQLYEADMWEDLKRARKAGVQVVGLYRTDLVTEPLAHGLRLRQTPAAVLRHVSGPASGRRLIVAEPSAGRSHGPFFRLARAIRDASNGLRTDVVVAGSRVASLRGLEPQDHELLDQAFEFAHWDALHELQGDAWSGVSRFARYLALDLERMSERLGIGRQDTVLFHTSNLVEIIGATHWLGSVKPDRLPSVRLLFHFLPENEAQWLKLTAAEVRHAYVMALALLTERAGDRLRILAQTSALATALERLLHRPVDAMGFPVPSRLRAASRCEPGSPVRLLYAGEARADKGFGMLPAVADELTQELETGRLTLVCQSMLNEFADEKILRATAALKARPGVELIDRFLPSADYDNLVAGCDLVLLPYDAAQYRSRLSAVFVDATCAGVLPIVPDQTWMSQQLAEGYGVGTTFSRLTPKSIAAAVRKSLRRIVPMKQDARDASTRVWERHEPHRVLETILGR